MTLTTAEQTILANIRVYITQAGNVLSTEGLKSLSKISQLKDILVKIADVSPKYSARLLREPARIVKDDQTRRAKTTRNQEREEARRVRQERREQEREAVEYRKAQRLAKKDAPKSRQAKRPIKRSSQVIETSEDDGVTGNRLGAKRPRMATTPNPKSSWSTAVTFRDAEPMNNTPSGSEPEQDSQESEQDDHYSDQNRHRFPRAAHNASSTDLVDLLRNAARPREQTYANQDSTSSLASDPIHRHLQLSTRRLTLTEQNTEVAIFSQDASMLEQLTDKFKTDILPQYITLMRPGKVNQEIKELFVLCHKLNFDVVKHRLLEFAEQRQKDPSSRAQIANLAENAEPIAIFRAIQVSAANEADAKLHRIYGQIQLVKSINRKIEEGYTPKTLKDLDDRKDVLILGPSGYFLDEMADEVWAGEQLELKGRTRARLRREYHAGRHWLKMIESLGGMGAVLVFVFAGMSSRMRENSGFNADKVHC